MEEAAAPAPRPKRGTETILIAEDDEKLERAPRNRADRLRLHRSSWANDGEDAVNKFRTHRDDIHLVSWT